MSTPSNPSLLSAVEALDVDLVTRMVADGARDAACPHKLMTTLTALRAKEKNLNEVQKASALQIMKCFRNSVDAWNSSRLLTAACAIGFTEMVAYLLSPGTNVDVARDDTPLGAALSNGPFIDIVKILIDHGASVTKGYPFKWLPVRNEASSEMTDLIIEATRVLLDAGASIDVRPSAYAAPLIHSACQAPNIKLLAFLLSDEVKADANAVNNTTDPQVTALRWLIRNTMINNKGSLSRPHCDAIKLLITQGNVKPYSSIFLDSLIHMRRDLCMSTFQFLIDECGVDVNICEKDFSYTPLHLIAASTTTRFLHSSAEDSDGDSSKSEDSDTNWMYEERPHSQKLSDDEAIEIIRFLLSRGADTSRIDRSGQTPLCLAARRASLRVMQSLLEASDVDSALIAAAVSQIDDLQKVQVLLGHGASVSDKIIGRLFSMPFVRSKPASWRCLFECGAGENVLDVCLHAIKTSHRVSMYRPLINEFSIDCGEVGHLLLRELLSRQFYRSSDKVLAEVEFLEKNHINIHLPLDSEGVAPWMQAVVFERFLETQYFIEKYGCSAAARTAQGVPLIHLAAGGNKQGYTREYSLSVVKYLISKGADVKAVDAEGVTFLMRAVEQCNTLLVEYLVKKCKVDVNAVANDGRTAWYSMERASADPAPFSYNPFADIKRLLTPHVHGQQGATGDKEKAAAEGTAATPKAKKRRSKRGRSEDYSPLC